VCIPVPFYHCFGMVMGNLACTSHGCTMVISAQGFDPGATLEAVQQERCTSLYGVPTMFIAELNQPDFADYGLSSLRTGIMAGSPCPVEVMKQVVSRMGMEQVTICYGMTETSPVSTQTRVHDSLQLRVSTVGRVHPHLEIKLVDPVTGLTVPRGEAGEAHYKIPRYVVVVDEFPMTVTGKVRKVEMREKSVQILGLGEAATIRSP
jgi:fatty-acyl-CoA synthase